MLGSYTPPASAAGNLNADAPARDTDAAVERPYSGLQNGISAAEPGAWNEATVRPFVSSTPQPDTFDRFFHNEIEPVPPSASSYSEGFRSTGLVSPPPSDPSTSMLPEPTGYLEKPNGSIGAGSNTGPASQKATHLFSLPTPISEPVVSSAGPSAFTRVINSSAQRADEEKPVSTAPAASNPPPQPALASAAAPFAAPQWPAGTLPSPQMYPLPYPPQPAAPMPQIPAASWPQAPAPPAVAPPPVTQPQMQPGEQLPQPGWIAYMPLIVGLNVLLLLTAILILVFALAK